MQNTLTQMELHHILCYLGVKGVRQRKNGKYSTSITISGNRIYLGRFDNIEKAALAYKKAAKKYFGEFAKY